MRQNTPSPSRHEALLRSLRNYPQFSPFELQVLDAEDAADAPPCGLPAADAVCSATCRRERDAAARAALTANRPSVFPCTSGLLHFAIPARGKDLPPLCLLGGTAREPAADSADIVRACDAPQERSGLLAERVDELPRATADELTQLATAGQALLPDLLAEDIHSLSREKLGRRIDMLAALSIDIDHCESEEEIVELLGEALVVLFDLPKLAVILANRRNPGFSLKKSLGLEEPAGEPPAGQVAAFLQRNRDVKAISLEKDGAQLLATEESGRGWAIPLSSDSRSLGLVALFDASPHPQDLQMMEMLAGRAALKLACLGREQRLREENALSERLLTLVGALALKESREEVHAGLVSMAADLLCAARGSLMLVDEETGELRIVASKGLSAPLAKSMGGRVGTGIAGRVARNGLPLLVNDIEKDSRVGIPNRPRFRTKSFLSVPLMAQGRPAGVLNLSDKEDGGIFTETDLTLLTSFVTHAALILERTASVERAARFEQLAVTDPLTRLYNRRFLETRLDEELSRSRRHALNFTVILVDLDNFKLYNDDCGHLAGDDALRRSAQLLRESAREMDIVTRYGGEEFCLLLPETAKKEALLVAERIRGAFEREPFPGAESLPGACLTASLGIASFPADGQSAAELVGAADVALYRAKEDGRNRFVAFDQTLQDGRQQRA